MLEEKNPYIEKAYDKLSLQRRIRIYLETETIPHGQRACPI